MRPYFTEISWKYSGVLPYPTACASKARQHGRELRDEEREDDQPEEEDADVVDALHRVEGKDLHASRRQLGGFASTKGFSPVACQQPESEIHRLESVITTVQSGCRRASRA